MIYGAMNFPVTDLFLEIETFTDMGFDYIEITMDPPMAHYSILSANLAEIKTRLQDNGLGLVCHLPTFLTTADLTESLRRASVDEMIKSLQVAADLGTAKAVLHPSMVFGLGMFILPAVRQYAYDFLGEIVPLAEKLGITLCLENMMPRNIFGVEADELGEILDAFPSLKLTLDTGHANIDDNKGNRLEKIIERFGNRIGHLHFSDNGGKRDDHWQVGRGTVDFPRLIQLLKMTGYDDTLTLEIFDENRQCLIDSRDLVAAMFS